MRDLIVLTVAPAAPGPWSSDLLKSLILTSGEYTNASNEHQVGT
jgi:hypothetical protein